MLIVVWWLLVFGFLAGEILEAAAQEVGLAPSDVSSPESINSHP